MATPALAAARAIAAGLARLGAALRTVGRLMSTPLRAAARMVTGGIRRAAAAIGWLADAARRAWRTLAAAAAPIAAAAGSTGRAVARLSGVAATTARRLVTSLANGFRWVRRPAALAAARVRLIRSGVRLRLRAIAAKFRTELHQGRIAVRRVATSTRQAIKDARRRTRRPT
jgi:hypothetical protein